MELFQISSFFDFPELFIVSGIFYFKWREEKKGEEKTVGAQVETALCPLLPRRCVHLCTAAVTTTLGV